MINLSNMNNLDLIAHIEGEILKYESQKAIIANQITFVYNTIGGNDLQVYSKALDRAVYNNPEALATKQKVEAILVRDFTNVMVHKPVGKIKSLHEIELEKNKMAINKFHDMKPVR